MGSATGKQTIAIVGLPNTGKSEIFGRLTGVYSLAANYPRTTVEEKRATCRIDGRLVDVIDTPGLHCLYIHSEEELAVRNLLYAERPDVLIQCIDANHLKQSLALTADLLELGIPFVVCLNAMDEAARNGTWIDSETLERQLGVPVVETIATDGCGIPDLKQALANARKGTGRKRYDDITERSVADIARALEGNVEYPWKTSALLLLDDPFIWATVKERIAAENLPLLEEKIKAARQDFGGNMARSILDQRGRWVDEMTGSVVRKRRLQLGSSAERFAHLSRHPVYGIPIFAAFLAVTFFMVVHVAGFLQAKLHAYVAAPVTDYLSNLLPTSLWKDFLVGHYGILTLGLFNALCTVLPILGTFFLAMSFFEDTGYIPNLCVLSRRVFAQLGLSGKSIMSLILAFGCRAMATLTTRGLTTFKEKFIANCLIAFTIPCGAQLALQIGILGRVGVFAFLFTFGTMILSLFIVGMALNKVMRDEEAEDYIQELPPARVPNPRAVLRKTVHRMLWFLKEALPLFLLAAAVLFVLETSGVLSSMKALLKPIAVDWMGLPPDIVDVLILCLARHEAAAGLLLSLVDSGGLTVAQTIVSVVLITMFVPCFAHIAAIARQMGLKTACLMISCTMTSALVVAGVLHHLLAAAVGG